MEYDFPLFQPGSGIPIGWISQIRYSLQLLLIEKVRKRCFGMFQKITKHNLVVAFAFSQITQRKVEFVWQTMCVQTMLPETRDNLMKEELWKERMFKLMKVAQKRNEPFKLCCWQTSLKSFNAKLSRNLINFFRLISPTNSTARFVCFDLL